MSLQNTMPWLITALIVSVIVMIAGVRLELEAMVAAAAALFAGLVLAVGWRINQPLWSLDVARITEDAAPVAARRNARLMAVSFAWGSVAMFAIYTLTGLRWQHGWQYGLGMALFAALTFGFGELLGRTVDFARQRLLLLRGLQLTVIQGVAALGGLIFLVGSGKLETLRTDWAANWIFLFGGIAIAGLSAIAVVTQRKLMQR